MTARGDYAVRAMLELASLGDERLTRDELAERQAIPPRYLEAILIQLRQGGLVVGQRGAAGGYRLTREPAAVSVAEVLRAVDGPLALVQGERPEAVRYDGASEHLADLWVGLRAAVRSVLEEVSLADLVDGRLPASVRDLVDDPDAWRPR